MHREARLSALHVSEFTPASSAPSHLQCPVLHSMPPKPHRVTRPRLAFSCLECGRQKRRCDKLRPRCTTCQRLGRTCVYNTGSRDPETGRVTGRGSQTVQHEQTIAHSPPSLVEHADNTATPSLDSLPTDIFLGSRLRRGARERQIGQGFWAFLNEKERPGGASFYHNLFYDEPEDEPSMPPSYISSLGLAKLLRHLPTKPVCDALLQSFLVRVYPIYPVVNLPTFKPFYHLFWDCFASNHSLSHPELVRDPTYICLLWAILYAGSSVLSHTEWGSTPLKNLDQLQTIDGLKIACSESLVACRHTDHPTLHSLTASIIAYHFDMDKGLSKSLFISTTLRLAQSMGLHRDPIYPELSTSSAEHRRRVWWHLVWLDVQTSIAAGLPTCCSGDMIYQFQMISDLRDPPSDTQPATASEITSSEHSAPGISVIMLCAIGRFHTAKLQHRLINLLHNLGDPRVEDIARLVDSTKELHSLMDGLITRIPVHGIPEKGFIPSILANASPRSNPALYKDWANEPTVLSTCTRIMLSLFKLETMIMLQQSLLPELSSTSTPHFSWNRMVQLCLNYLQCYLHLCQAPAFDPYSWFWSSYHGPRRCILLILHYLEYIRSDGRDRQDMLFCVDEFINYWCSISRLVTVQCGSTSLSMNILIKIRQQIGTGTNRHVDQGYTTGDTINSAVQSAPRDIDYLAGLFDSEYWASLG